MKELGQAVYATKTKHELVVRLLGRQHTIDVVAVSIPEEAPQEPRPGWLKQIFEHMLTALRLSYEPRTDVVRTGDAFLTAMNQTDNAQPTYGLAFVENINSDHMVDIKNVLGLFRGTATVEQATTMALLAESQLPTMPPHYQALSLIRALELLFEKREMRDWYDRFENEFASLGASRQKFKNAVAEMRTRCAHGVSRGGAPPFTGIGINNEDHLRPVITLLRKVVAEAIKDRFGIPMQVRNPQ